MTFLRFFEVRAGASDPGADEGLSLDEDLLLDTIDVEASFPWSTSLALVILGEAAPLDLRAASGINRSGVGGFRAELGAWLWYRWVCYACERQKKQNKLASGARSSVAQPCV